MLNKINVNDNSYKVALKSYENQVFTNLKFENIF